MANNSPGTKYDADKARWDLLPFDALDACADVLRHGAKKYGDRNWEDSALSQERLIGAMLRHTSAHMQKRLNDADSGLLHLAHAATSALMALAKELRREQ